MKLSFILEGVFYVSADWRANSWNVDFVPLDHLIDNLSKLPKRSEDILNRTIKNRSGQNTIKSIVKDVPISDVKRRITQRKHAKSSNPLKVDYINLGFRIRPKPRFDYLKYPDLGIGTSIKNDPKEFMRKGMEAEIPAITEDLNNELLKEIDKTLGGK